MADKSTLRANVWDTVYTYLQTTNPISTNNIYSSRNSQLIKSVGYPMVIISPPSLGFNKVTQDGQIISSTIVLSFQIFHNNSANLKTLSDNVTTKLLAGRQTFAGQRFMNMEIEPGDYDNWEEGQKTIHIEQFNVNFRYVQDG